MLLDYGVLGTYQDQVRGHGRLPDKGKWNQLRNSEEGRWFENYTERIYYAVLSLDERGASGWGPVALVLKSHMIEDRTTVGESNVATFGATLAPHGPVPPGYRAQWSERSKLCVAKLHRQVLPNTSPDAFPGILLRSVGDRATDDFVEVHIYGMFSIECVERVRMARRSASEELIDKLSSAGVRFELVD